MLKYHYFHCSSETLGVVQIEHQGIVELAAICEMKLEYLFELGVLGDLYENRLEICFQQQLYECSPIPDFPRASANIVEKVTGSLPLWGWSDRSFESSKKGHGVVTCFKGFSLMNGVICIHFEEYVEASGQILYKEIPKIIKLCIYIIECIIEYIINVSLGDSKLLNNKLCI